MTGRLGNPYDEAPAAWRLWQWVVQRIPAKEVSEFAEVMRGYRDEVRAEVELRPRGVAAPATQVSGSPSH